MPNSEANARSGGDAERMMVFLIVIGFGFEFWVSSFVLLLRAKHAGFREPQGSLFIAHFSALVFPNRRFGTLLNSLRRIVMERVIADKELGRWYERQHWPYATDLKTVEAYADWLKMVPWKLFGTSRSHGRFPTSRPKRLSMNS